MATDNKSRMLVLILTLAACCGVCSGEDRLQTLEQNCRRFREFQVRLDQAGSADAAATAQQCLKACDAAPVPAGALAGNVFALYRARLLHVAGKRDEAIAAFAALAGSPAVAPEALDSLARIFEPADYHAAEAEDYEAGDACEELLSAVAPTAGGGSGVIGTTHVLSDEYDAYSTPPIDERPLGRIAGKFAKMGMHKQAAQACREAIYAADFGLFLRYASGDDDEYWDRHRMPWRGHGVPAMWLMAAREEWLSGVGSAAAGGVDRAAESAADCIAKAIISGGEREAQKGFELIARIRQEPNPKPEPPKPDPEWLKRIAWFYTEMNMHPRALAILREHRELLGESARVLEPNYADAWLYMLDHHGEGGGCIVIANPPKFTVLFDQPAATLEERLKIAIPPPCSPAALAKAKERMPEIIKSLKPETSKE